MISDARGGHVSPGIYTDERDVLYSVKSLGITSLGMAGETLKGPAFQKIDVEKWSDYVDYFGGTSTERFKENGFPRYELPYIAKSYLKESKRLTVVRVLGLSGYDAGPAWVLGDKGKPIMVLRSKMTYKPVGEDSICTEADDKAEEVVTNIESTEYRTPEFSSECEGTGTDKGGTVSNYKMGIKVTCKSESSYKGTYTYNISLNPRDKDYIYNVLGKTPTEGEAPIYVDSVFESMINPDTPISGLTFEKKTNEEGEDEYYTSFKEAFRCAQTPWIVSNLNANIVDDNKVGTMKKLFKFYTISDGNAANYQVKISIQNIKPEEGTFDVVVRDFYDTDISPVVLEKFSKCTMVEGDYSFIGYKIGTYDGSYETKSKYITVEIAEGENLAAYVPAGYLGYPTLFGKNMSIKYNCDYNSGVKAKKQYFGLNESVLETDVLDYKGKFAYTNGDAEPGKLTNGFHLDSLLSKPDFGYTESNVFVDGVSGYTFSAVSADKVTAGSERIPRIIEGSYMDKTIYKDVNLRKFTVYPYGGFDGWDLNRGYRTNTDKYSVSKYPMSGSTAFDRVSSTGYAEILDLPTDAITTDYYAFLGGYRQFANPDDVAINLFATPGIDWYHNTSLVNEVFDIIEDTDDGRGGDALYIVTTPQYNEFGQMFTPDEISEERDNMEIVSSYACSYYPWVKYFDSTQTRYIDLPVTKDIVRIIAKTDNTSYPWFAPAGTERGTVECINAVKKTTIKDEDVLYESFINPVKTFAQDGVKIWGNKTLYPVDSPLNRVNTRRLMIRLKDLIKSASKKLIFEQYDSTIETQFRGLVEPILSDAKTNGGISDYKLLVEITPEAKDQHILPAKILVKPTPALEYISLSFVVYPESVEFEE